MYTFLVTNSKNKTIGNFILVDNFDGSILFHESTENKGRPIAYAPLGVGRGIERGNWKHGSRNSNDMLVWGELYVESRGVEDEETGVTWFDGDVHYFQLPSTFDSDNISVDIASQTGNQLMKTTLAAPTVPEHGRGAFFSFNAGQIRGWTKGK